MSLWITDSPIAICDRCKQKFRISELGPDPNSPGLRVCREDRDLYDPYRLAPRQPEKIQLDFPRPDVPLSPQQPYLVTEGQQEPIVLQEDDTEISP